MIILTGGAGFIGSCMLSLLNAAGRSDVLVVDALRDGEKWKNLVGRSFIDLVSKDEFRDSMAVGDYDDVEVVIHLGACSTTTERNADYLFDNNTRYSKEVAEYALDKKARFIYASSAATYGDGSKGYNDDETDLRPLNMYGFSKHMFDEWIRENGLDTQCVGLKFFNVFGPNEYHKADQASMVFKAAMQIKRTGKVKLFKSNDDHYSNGEQMRDFVYVKDACNVVMQLVQDTTVNGIFNLGSGVARTWNDLVIAVFNSMGIEPNIEYMDMPKELQEQYQNFTQADMAKLKAAIPALSFASLEDSIKDYVGQHLSSNWQYF